MLHLHHIIAIIPSLLSKATYNTFFWSVYTGFFAEQNLSRLEFCLATQCKNTQYVPLLVSVRCVNCSLSNWHTVNDLLNARCIYLIFVLKKGRGYLIDTRRLLEGDIYFLSKVTHSNHYHNKVLNSNNFHTTFAEACKNKLDEVVYILFILGKTLSVMAQKIISGIYVITAP